MCLLARLRGGGGGVFISRELEINFVKGADVWPLLIV